MANGWSLHVGVNRVDPDRFATGMYPALSGCDRAAEQYAALARKHGMQATLLTSTADTQLGKVTEKAKQFLNVAAGDLVVITFNGHGDRVPDTNGDETKDQAMVLYDRYLIDDAIGKLIQQFTNKIRLLLVADCCYSGSIFANLFARKARNAAAPTYNLELIVFAASKDTDKTEAATGPGSLPPLTGYLLDLVARGVPTYDDLGGELMKMGLGFQYLPIDAGGFREEPPFCVNPDGKGGCGDKP